MKRPTEKTDLIIRLVEVCLNCNFEFVRYVLYFLVTCFGYLCLRSKGVSSSMCKIWSLISLYIYV